MSDNTLIIGGAPCSLESFRADLISSASRIVAVDSGANLCLAAGRAPDVLVGDLDSISAHALAFAKAGDARILELEISKDVTDLEAALNLAIQEDWMAPTLTAVVGGRCDHELAMWGACAHAARLSPMILEPTVTAAVLSAGARGSFHLSGCGRVFSLFSMKGPARVSITGVEYPLDHGMLEQVTGQGVSNRVLDTATVTVHDGTVLLISPEQPLL